MDKYEMREIDLGMSNFDGSIDEGMADALKKDEGVYGRHAGWDFNGLVYYRDGKFHEDVYCYGTKQETMNADSLDELMEMVNSKYGYR